MMYELIPVKPTIRITAWNYAEECVRPEGFVFDGEMHDFWEMVYVVHGHAIASAEEQIYNLSDGQLLFHKPMEFHRIRSGVSSSPHILLLSFSAEGSGMKQFEKKCFSLTEEERLQYREVFDLAESSDRLYETGPKETYEAVAAKAATALEYFLHCLSTKEELHNQPVSKNEENYKKIVCIMHEHYKENLTIAQLSKLCGMSDSNMKRLFSLYCDRSIAKYFLTIKIQKAIKMMKEGLDSVEIAEILGFSSVNYFHTVFHRETGMTPGQYRKKQIFTHPGSSSLSLA